MIRPAFACLAFVVALLAPALPAAAQAPSDNEAILAAARAFDQAQQQGDRATLERMIAPDFLIVQGSGKVGGKTDFIAGFIKPDLRLDPLVIADRLFLRVAPDVAIVGGEARISGVEDGQRVTQHFRYADTFVRRGGAWVVAFAQVTGLGR